MKELDEVSRVPDAGNTPIVVKGFGNESDDWEENSTITNHSKNVLSFTLTRQCEVGHLLSLGNLDENRESVWGMVSQCTSLISDTDQSQSYNIGVALIGDAPPTSYFQNPSQRYRLSGVSPSGFWSIEQAYTQPDLRKHPRYLASIEAYIVFLDDSLKLGKGEKVFTENISYGGAALCTTLNVEIGDCLKFISAKYEFSALVMVRNISKLLDGRQKVHLEFAAGKFPMEKLELK